MNRLAARASSIFKITPRDTIEWEEMPSLIGQVTQPLKPMNLGSTAAAAANRPTHETPPHAAEAEADPGAPWGVTMPAELDTPVQPLPFREPLRGLVMREVNEPELFRYFFSD